MPVVRLTFLSAFAIAACLSAGAVASEVKGPVRITGSGVEMLTPGEWEAAAARSDDDGTAREAHAAARAAIHKAIREGRATARAAQREARSVAREARAGALEAAREARAHARAAMDEAMAELHAATGHLRLNVRYTVDAHTRAGLTIIPGCAETSGPAGEAGLGAAPHAEFQE